MSWIVLVDLRSNNGHIVTLEDENGNIAQFESEEEAQECAANNPMCGAFDSYAVSLDDQEINLF